MGVNVQTKKMAMLRECFCLDLASVEHVAPLCLQWPLAQLFPAAWADSLGHCSVYCS
jgi:hypothetical protein